MVARPGKVQAESTIPGGIEVELFRFTIVYSIHSLSSQVEAFQECVNIRRFRSTIQSYTMFNTDDKRNEHLERHALASV